MSPAGLWGGFQLNRLPISSRPWPTQLTEDRAGALRRFGEWSRDSSQLERALFETLDLASHRLDAWITSLATRRLAEIRSSQKIGLRLGAIGWVEDLKPASAAARTAGGYIHAPSLNHAAAAAVMRNAHRSSDDESGQKYAFELSSERVRGALELIERARRGVGVAEQLGYQIERDLHEQSLDHLILPLRRVFPLQSTRTDAEERGRPEAASTEDVGPRDVLNGEALARQMRDRQAGTLLADRDPAFENGNLQGQTSGGASLRPGYIPWGDTVSIRGAVFPRRDSEEGRRLKLVLTHAADRLDALGDLLAAEVVYQGVQGRSDGLKSALDAMSRGGALPTPEITRSPVSARGVKHRVAILVGADAQGHPGWVGGAGAIAEPRLHALMSGLLGPPAAYGCAVVDDQGRTHVRTGEELGLAPWRLLGMATAGEPGHLPAELRLRALRAAGWPGGAPWQIVPPDPESGLRPLGDLLELARALASLLSTCRPLTAQDCAPEEIEVPASAARMAALEQALEARVPGLIEALGRLDVSLRPLRDVLLRMYGVDAEVSPELLWAGSGLDGSLSVEAVVVGLLRAADFGPFAPSPETVAAALGATDSPERRQAVAVAQSELLSLFRHACAQLDAWGLVVKDGSRPAEERIRACFGGALMVLPPFGLPTDAELARAGVARSAWLLRDELSDEPRASAAQIAPWLLEASRVRPAVQLWSEVRRGAEAVHRRWRRRSPGVVVPRPALHVAQLPRQPEGAPRAPWIGLPGAHAGGEIAWVFDQVGALDPDRCAGLLVDAWTESIPDPEATTGVAFHFDDAGAEAPQAVLLAVHPDASATSWNRTALLAVLNETIDLVKLRAVDLEALRARAAAVGAAPTAAEGRLLELARMLPAILIGLQNDPSGNAGLDWLRNFELAFPGEEA